jgi:cytochrome c
MLIMRTLAGLIFMLCVCHPASASADMLGHGGMVRSVAFSPDGRRVLTGSFDFSSVLWDFEEQRELAVLDGHAGPVSNVKFLPDGLRAVTAGDDGVVIIWQIASDRPKILKKLNGHSHKVMALAISPDGQWLASGGWDKTVRVWRLSDGALQRQLDVSVPVNAIAFVRDGSLIAVGGHDPFIRLYDPITGRAKGKLEGHQMGITDMSVSQDGQMLLSSSIDKTVRLWDLQTFTQSQIYERHESQVFTVRFLPDDTSFISAGRDGYVVHWDRASGKVLRSIKAHEKIVWSLAIAPNGKFVVSGSSDDTARVWHLETGDRIGIVANGDLDNEPKPWLESDHPGARLFSKCARCHALSANARRRSGPHLKGLFGRPVGSVPGYNYSPALRGKNFSWDQKTLFDLFDKGPDKLLPGTKMPVQRVPDAQALAQLVDYLRQITASTNASQ